MRPNRWLILVGILAYLGLLAGGVPAAAAPSTTPSGVALVQLPAGTVDISLGGIVVGNAAGSTGGVTPFLIPDPVNNPTTVVHLGPLPGALNTTASAIVDTPQGVRIFGVAQISQDTAHAFCMDYDLTAGKLTKNQDLNPPGYSNSAALDANLLGEWIGYGLPPGGDASLPYFQPAGKPGFLLNGVVIGYGTDVNSRGFAVGDALSQDFSSLSGWDWQYPRNPVNSMYGLYTIGGPNTAYPRLNNLNQILYTADDAQKVDHAVFFDTEKSVKWPLAPAGFAMDVADNGWAITADNSKAGAPISEVDVSNPPNFPSTPTGLVTGSDYGFASFASLSKIKADGTIQGSEKAGGGFVPTLAIPQAGVLLSSQSLPLANSLLSLKATLIDPQVKAAPDSDLGRILFAVGVYLTDAARHLTQTPDRVTIPGVETGRALYLLKSAWNLLHEPVVGPALSQPAEAAIQSMAQSIFPGFPAIPSMFAGPLSGPTPPPSGPRLVEGQAVAHSMGIGLLPDNLQSTAVTTLAGVLPNGTLVLQDWAGTALLGVPPAGAPAAILVDPSTPAPSDGVGIARLLRTEVSASGIVGIQALRADNQQGFYRLANGSLTLVGLRSDPRAARELAISDGGAIAYVANLDPTNPASPVSLFQAGNGAPVELLRQGQAIFNGATVAGFSDLTGNGNGNLAVRVALNGTPNQAVLEFTRTGGQIVAKSGDAVLRGRGSGVTGVLTEQRRPVIGPDDSVVFLGAGSDFVNFYVARPGRGPAPLLTAPGTDLSIVEPAPPATLPPSPSAGHLFDYEIAADGTVALQASLANPTDSTLLLISPAGGVTPVVSGNRAIEPILRPVFGPGGVLFFQAEDQTRLTDRNGQLQGGLYRFRPGAAAPERVAMPGDHIPSWSSDTRLLSLTQRPIIANNSLFIGAVFGGPESYPVPTAALFRVPLNGTLADNGAPVVREGYPVADAGRLAMLRELSYQPDGTLAAYGLMPGAGPLVAPAPASAATAGVVRTQAAPPAAGIMPLVAQGDPLGGGQLENIVPPLVPVGTDRELFGARTSLTQVPDHEGLFTVGLTTKELVAINRNPVPDRTGTFFNGFADTRFADSLGLPDKRLFTLSPSSVGPNGQLVFKAEVDRGGPPASGQLPLFGIFQWSSGGVPSTVGLSDDPLVPGDRLPYVLENWASAPGGRPPFFLVRTDGGKGPARLLVSPGAGKWLTVVVPGSLVTPPGAAQATPLTDLTDFVFSRDGALFVAGVTTGGAGIFRVMGNPFPAVAAQGMPVPPFADGTPTTGFTFAGGFQLLPSTARGPKLLFRAMVQKPGGAARLGEFEWTATAGLQTRSIVGVAVNGARTLTADVLGDTTLELQNGNGTAVSAYLSDKGSWAIVRSRVSGNSTVSETIAQDGKGTDASVRRFTVLDAGPLLDQEGLPPHDGPVFTLNDAGEVALLASDGMKWGIYSIPLP
jgi:hypothetical protein